MPDRMTPEQVATLERAIGTWLTFSPLREWAILMLQGNDVPTVEQWEAAERLAALARNDAHPDSIVAKLANVISPPEPPPLPEIAACPYCGAHGDLVGGAVQCRARCNYVGPARDNAHDSIEAHNAIARKLRPEPQDDIEKLNARIAELEDWQRRALAWMRAEVAGDMSVRCGCPRCAERMRLVEEATR